MPATRRVPMDDPFDLAAVMFAVLGPGGNTSRRAAGTFYVASITPEGPVQLAVRRDGSDVVAEAWGPGSDNQLETLPRLLGFDDDPGEFQPPPGPVHEVARRMRGLRLGSTHRVWEVVAPTILAQRITTGEAKLGYRRLVQTYGEAAPGPEGLTLPPAPQVIAGLSYEDLHRHGIERNRADILREAARRAKRLEEILNLDRDAAYARLHAVRGIGPWTSGHVMGVAWGDRDAVPVGDFHLPNTVAWALAGEDRADDDRMLELLQPYRPHRRRVVTMLKRSGASAPNMVRNHQYSISAEAKTRLARRIGRVTALGPIAALRLCRDAPK